MDGFDNSRIGPGSGRGKPIKPDDAPIPFDDGDNLSDSSISHVPVLGSAGAGKTAKKIVSSRDRITGVKTFCIKLHKGSIAFIDERINEWLADNPGIVIKRTNTVTGMLTGKITEPNIIISVWY